MRINNVEYPNVSIRVIESKRVVGLTGPKSIHLYEANIKRGAVIQKRTSENIAELQAGRTHQKLSNEPRYRSPFIGDLTRGTF